MSRGLCRNYLSFFLAFWYEALGSGRVERHRLLPVLEGEAVKAGTLGPPAGAALTASAFMVPATIATEPPSGGSWPPLFFRAQKRWGRHSSDLTIARELGEQAVGFGCRTFLRPVTLVRCMVSSGHSQAGTFSSSASPRSGATSFYVLAPWLRPNLCSSDLFSQAPDLAVRSP